MKSFLASLILLASLLISSILNCAYIDKVTEEMLDLEKSFPTKKEDGESPPARSIIEAKELWEASSARLFCTAKAGYVNTVTAALYNTADYYEHGTYADYITSRTLLVEALEALRASDSLSLKSII